jgi:hypothetical protein
MDMTQKRSPKLFQYLIRPFGIDYDDTDFSIRGAYEEIKKAHDFLVQQARPTLRALSKQETHDCEWGAVAKRQMVPLPPEGRPLLIQKDSERLTEVMNMCATVERLLDALLWAEAYRFPEYLVQSCHPTASSNKEGRDKGGVDNDLVLIPKFGDLSKVARFEVSDVCGDGDGNDKERKDLESLDVLLKEKRIAEALNPKWPDGHLFLVVAEKFGNSVMKGGRRTWRIKREPNAHCVYYDHAARKGTMGREGTMIIEVVDGRLRAQSHCAYKCCSGLQSGADIALAPSAAVDLPPISVTK